jgi:probable HAF family extracellular repeat protein
MRQRKIFVGLLSILTVVSNAVAQHSGAVQSMKLQTSQVGWAASENRVFRTNNAGENWKDITPKAESSSEIASVFFLNGHIGWVLFSVRDAITNDVARFDLSSTTNGGASWITTPVRIPNFDSRSNALAGDARMYFVDSSHGWVDVGVVGSAAVNPGFLLKTMDDGKTWLDVSLPGELEGGTRGSVRFIDSRTGWFTNDSELYVTHDGSNTWEKVSLKLPREIQSAINPTYGVPNFFPRRDSLHGFLPVTYSGPRGTKSVLVLFETTDGGRSWKSNRVLPDLKETSIGQMFPTAVVDSLALAAVPSDLRHTVLTKIVAEGYPTVMAELSFGISDFSFVNSSQGWALSTDGRLVSTNDSGVSWADVTPGFHRPTRPNESAVLPTSSSQQPDISSINVPATASLRRRLAFDEKFVADEGDMSTWWNSSPYFEVGFYPNGGYNHTTDPNLDSTWVSDVQSQGWGFMPVWVDYQSPCACKYGKGTYPNCTYGPFKNVISKDSTNNYQAAYNEGVASADCAATAMGNGNGSCRGRRLEGLGLAGTVVYVDIEGYSPSYVFKAGQRCGATVNRFLDGWMSEIQAKGYTAAGAYGNPAPAASWNKGSKMPPYPPVSPLPSDIWVAKSDNRVTIWGLNSPGSGLTDAMWPKDQRIHQYKTDTSETWPPGGTVTLKIDKDIANATIIAGNGGKSYSFENFSSIDCDGAQATSALGINNLGQIVGSYTDANNVLHGFLWKNNSCQAIDCNGTGTFATSINNLGQIVGGYFDSAGEHAFLYTNQCVPIASTLVAAEASGINDDGQVVGSYQDCNYGFVYNTNTKKTTKGIEYHGSNGNTCLRGINGDGLIVGDTGGGSYPAFLYDPATSNFTPLGFSNVTGGLNNNFEVTVDGNPDFLFDYASGSDSPVSYSLAQFMSVASVSDCIQGSAAVAVVGSYVDKNNKTHGFLATPKQ